MKRLVPPLLVALAALAAFYPAVHYGFLYWDDVKNIVTNPFPQHLNRAFFRWMLTTHFQGPYQPLSWLSLAVNFHFSGLRPLAYHVTNLALHAANAALLYGLLLRLYACPSPGLRPPSPLRGKGWGEGRSSVMAAALGALFFAVHPLRVESVVWITERRDVLSGFFFLLTLSAYVRGWRAVAWALFVAALVSKATTVGLVWALVALDITALNRLPYDVRRWAAPVYRAVWLEKLPYVGLAFIAGMLNLAAFHTQGILQSRYGLFERLALLAHNAAFYVQKAVWPHPLLPYYELPIRLQTLRVSLALHAAAAVLLTVWVVRMRKRWPGLWVAWATYVLMLLPVSGLAQNGQQIAADRYSYLASLPWAALATAALARNAAWQAVAWVLVSGLGVLSWRQTRIWRNDEALWTHTLRYAPNTYLAASNLGTLYVRQGRDREAETWLTRALVLRPTDNDARLNLGVLAERSGRYAEAEAYYRTALAQEPGHLEVRNNLALLRARAGDFAQAIRMLQEIVADDPTFAEAQLNLGILLAHEGRTAEAAPHLRQAVALNPELAPRIPRSIP